MPFQCTAISWVSLEVFPPSLYVCAFRAKELKELKSLSYINPSTQAPHGLFNFQYFSKLKVLERHSWTFWIWCIAWFCHFCFNSIHFSVSRPLLCSCKAEIYSYISRCLKQFIPWSNHIQRQKQNILQCIHWAT